MTTLLTKPDEKPKEKNPSAFDQLQSGSLRHHQRWRPVNLAKVAAQSTLALCVFIFLLESVFQIANVGQQDIIQPDPILGCWHIPNKLVTWRFEGYSHERFSSIGLRDREFTVVKPAGTVRIALLGDSATEGLQVSLNETFAKVLEKQLNDGNRSSRVRDFSQVSATGFGSANASRSEAPKRTRYEVMNFGCSSYSTGQQLVLYKTLVSSYKPDYVVVFYSKGDSLENCLESTKQSKKRKADPRAYFYLDKSGSLQVDASVLELNSAKLHPSAFENYLRANSCIWGVLSQTNLQLLLHEKYYMRAKNSLANILAKIDEWQKRDGNSVGAQSIAAKLREILEIERTAPPVGVVAPSVPAAPAAVQSTVLPADELNYEPQDKLKVTTAIFEKLGSSITADGGKLIVMTFPGVLADPDYANHRAQLKKMSQDKGYGFLDLDSPVNSHPVPMSLFLAYHFSKAGHELIAQQLLELLTKNYNLGLR